MAVINIEKAKMEVDRKGWLDIARGSIPGSFSGNRKIEERKKCRSAGALLPGCRYPGCGGFYRGQSGAGPGSGHVQRQI